MIMVNSNEMIFGVRAVLEALEAGKEVDKILVKRDIQSELSRELFAALKGRTIPVLRVPVEKLNRITRKNHQGVLQWSMQRQRLLCLLCMKREKCLSLCCSTALPTCVISVQ